MGREIIIIAAVAENRVIGQGNRLPWSIKADMVHFKEKTLGFPCIMGRKTYESLPVKPLPKRLNVVISSTLRDEIPPVKVCSSLQAGLDFCRDYEKIFICGGSSIYQEAIGLADTIELTKIHASYPGDAYFPEINPDDWRETAVSNQGAFSFITLVRKKLPVQKMP